MDIEELNARLSAFRDRLPELIHEYPPDWPDFWDAFAVCAEGFREDAGDHAAYAMDELRRFLAECGIRFPK